MCMSVDDNRIHRLQPVLIMADPPYVPSCDVAGFPDHPPEAIDGGADGLGPARAAMLAVQHLAGAGVPVVLQLRGLDQVVALGDWLTATGSGVAVGEVRCVADDRTLAMISRRTSWAPAGQTGVGHPLRPTQAIQRIQRAWG